MENKVLAVVNGRNITQQDFNMLMQGLGQQAAMQFSSPEGQKRLLEELVNQELFYADAVDTGMENEEAFKAELEQMKVTALKQYYMKKLLNSVKVEDKEADKYYNDNKDKFKMPESVKASHILVDSEEKAKEILAEIKDGLSFEEAAKNNSKCPSNAQGGDLGEFTRGRMVPEFEDAAFAMEVDEISEPVKTQFGYHIIKVTNKTVEKTMSLEESKPKVIQYLTDVKRNELYLNKSSELKGKYEVKINE